MVKVQVRPQVVYTLYLRQPFTRIANSFTLRPHSPRFVRDMIKDLRNTFRQTAIYGMSNIFVKAAGLIILPIYTSTLTTDEYGVLVMLEIFSQFFVGVISFSIPTAMLRLGSDHQNKAEQNKIYFTALVFLLGLVICFVVLFFPLSEFFSRLVFDRADYSVYFRLLFLSIGMEILGTLPLQLMRLKEESTRYLMFFSLKLVALIGLVWYFVVFRNMGVYGAMWGITLANAVLLVATAIYQLKNIRPVFDRRAAVDMYKYGAPLIFTTVSGILLTIADRVIIKLYGELSDVGIYGLAYKVGSASNLLIIGSFALGFLPIAFKKFGDQNFDRFFSKMFTYFIGITAVLTLVVSLFSQEAIKVISSDNPDYWQAVVLVPFIAFAFVFKAMHNYLAYIFLLIKRTKFHAFVTVVGVVINIALNFLFIPKYGIYGAIAATGLSFALMALITYNIAQKRYPIHYEMTRIGLLLLVVAVFIAAGLWANNLTTEIRLLIKSLFMVAFVLLLYFGFADKVEREKMHKVRMMISKNGWKKALSELTKD